MGIYIPIDLPEIDGNKSIKAEIRKIDGEWEFGIMTGGYYCSQQWSFYPLAEVQPHGRLIDADALLSKDADVQEVLIDFYGFIEDTVCGFSAKKIREAPTIIEADSKTI